MCIACLRSRVDITEGITKQVSLYFCKGCEKYQQAQGQWIFAALESRELLTLCLKKLKGLDDVRLVDANFVWTEPHSRRIKVKLSVQKEVFNGAILQKVFVVEYVVNRHMCEACHRVEAKDYWNALCQVRQRVPHKKTFYYLEQLLLKAKPPFKYTQIGSVGDGLDFSFDKKDDARKLADYLCTVVPCRYTTSQRLISQDCHSNTYNYKSTYSVTIAPICKDDIVVLPDAMAKSLGNIGQICVCLRVTNQIYLIDPFSLKTGEVNASMYFKTPFNAIASVKNLTAYTIMEVDQIHQEKTRLHGHYSEKHALADVWVVKSSELGLSDPIHCKTHLGHLLKPFDEVLAFDLKNSNVNDSNFEKLQGKANATEIDVIIVKKFYGSKAERKAQRAWKLRRMVNEDRQMLIQQTDGNNGDFEEFIEDLEEDPLSRQAVNIYKDKAKAVTYAVDADEQDPSVPRITLAEMLDDLVMED